MWIDLFSVYLHSPFTASIIFDSMLEYLNATIILTRLRMISRLDLLNEYSTSANRSMRFWKRPILNTSNDMTIIGLHISFRLGIRFGCIFIKRGSQDPITSFIHFDMGHTPSPRKLLTIPLN